MRQTRMSGAMRGSQETKTVSKGTRLRACSLLYSIMSLIKSLILLKTHSHAKMAPDSRPFAVCTRTLSAT